MQRREWLRQCGSAGVLAGISSTVAARNTAASRLVAQHNSDAFNDTLQQLLQGQDASTSDQVIVHLKPDAINAAVVPVEIISTHPQTLRICVLVDAHETALVTQMNTASEYIEPRLSTHVQLHRPAQLLALVETSSGWLKNSKAVLTLHTRCQHTQ